MPSAVNIIVGAVVIVIGLSAVYSGHKFFKSLLSFIGFVFGFMLGIELMPEISVVSIIISLVIAAVMSGLAYAFYKLAVIITLGYLGITLGGTIAQSLFNIADANTAKTVGLVIGIIIAFVFIALKVDKKAIIFITSVLGAYMVVVGFAVLFENYQIQISLSRELLPRSIEQFKILINSASFLITSKTVYLIVFLGLCITGVLSQERSYKE